MRGSGLGVGASLQQQQQQQQHSNHQQMGKMVKTFQAYLPECCHRTYSCVHCRAHLANHDELISKVFIRFIALFFSTEMHHLVVMMINH